MNFYKFLDNNKNSLFDGVSVITILLYIAIVFNMSVRAPQYLDYLNGLTKLFISLSLIYRFNPFRRIKFNSFDAKIAFNAGLFLFATSAINDMLINYLLSIHKL